MKLKKTVDERGSRRRGGGKQFRVEGGALVDAKSQYEA
jgi:hypothetical protein